MTSGRPHVVVDARMAMDGGIGTYLQQLLPRIASSRPDWRFTTFGDQATLTSLGWGDIANVTVQHVVPPIFSVREQLALPLAIPASTDLYWAPNYNVGVLSRHRIVVTIHDVNHVALPELMGGIARRTYARALLSAAVRRARHLLFDSEFTRSEARRLLGERAHGTVVHLGVEPAWWHARELAPSRPLQEPYFVYVGNIKLHKNVPTLLRAFRAVSTQLPHKLVLIGRTRGLRADPGVGLELERLQGRVVMAGEVSARDVMRYVAHADALVSASLYEGFGLPAIEAMAAGCPCVVSTAGSHPEICGDAALYADPRDEQAFSQRLMDVARDAGLRATLQQRGRERAALFDWDRSASSTTAVLEGALA